MQKEVTDVTQSLCKQKVLRPGSLKKKLALATRKNNKLHFRSKKEKISGNAGKLGGAGNTGHGKLHSSWPLSSMQQETMPSTETKVWKRLGEMGM